MNMLEFLSVLALPLLLLRFLDRCNPLLFHSHVEICPQDELNTVKEGDPELHGYKFLGND